MLVGLAAAWCAQESEAAAGGTGWVRVARAAAASERRTSAVFSRSCAPHLPSAPSTGDGTSWDEADYSWDPLSMTATALRSPAGPRHTQEAQAGRGARPSLAPRSAGCSAAAGVDKFIASLVHAGGASEADSQGGTPSPADGTSGGAGGGGGAGGATAAAAAAAAQASDEEGGGGAAPPPTRARGTRQRKAGGGGAAAAAAAAAPCVCQADGCGADLTSLTFYFKRNK